MKNFKTLIVTLVLFLAINFASQAQFSIGGGLSYGFEIENLGINLRGLYEISDEIDAAPSFTYFLPNDVGGGVSWNVWEFNLDGHYNFTPEEDWEFYGIGGLGITGWKIDYPSNSFFGGSNFNQTSIGLNLGAGTSTEVSDNIRGFGEVKYSISDFDQLVVTIGVTFGLD